MMNLRRWLIAGLTLLLVVSSQSVVFAKKEFRGSEPMNGGALPYTLPEPPDYVQFFSETYQNLTQEMNDRVFLNRATADPRRLTSFASMAVQLYQQTNDETYLADAKRVWDIQLGVWKNSTASLPNDFFINEGLLIAYDELKKHNMVDPDDIPVLLQVIKHNNWFQKGDDNQALSRALGELWSVKAFPDDPDAGTWQENADAIWNYWYDNRDLMENASHYSSVGLAAVIRIAKLSGREELLKDPEVRLIFERYRDQLSPNGAMPEYGDDYFGDSIEWIYIFEYAARLYQDPTFLDAAWKAYWFIQNNFPIEHVPGNFDADLWSLVQLFDSPGLMSLTPTDMAPAMNPVNSRILTRNKPGTPNAVDKLVLTSSRIPGSPFVMSELFGFGSHSHMNRVGAIQYYESDAKPLYHGMSRNNKGATDSNVVAMMPTDSSSNFPLRTKDFEPDIWYQESVPAQLLATENTLNNQVKFDPLNLRLQSSVPIDFVIDNLRLEGPAGVKQIDSFEDLAKWTRSDNPYSLTTDHTEGNTALNIKVQPGASAFYTAYGWNYSTDPNVKYPGYDLSFNLNDYTVIKYDWKYKAPGKVSFNFLFRMLNDNNLGIDTLPGDMNNVPTVSDAIAENVANDAYGAYTLNSYFTYDTEQTRKMVLTKEGFLIVVDQLITGETAVNQTAGPIWYTYAPGDRGRNWFDSPEEDRTWKTPDGNVGEQPNLLVYFADGGQGDQREFGINTNVSVTNNNTPAQVVYAKQPVTPGESVFFVSVLVPHNPLVKASDIADRIQVVTENGETTVTLNNPETAMGTIKISIGPGGWAVKRSGDVDGDGYIDGTDLELAKQYFRITAIDQAWEQAIEADVNLDGKINVEDIAYISKMLSSQPADNQDNRKVERP